MNVIYHEKQDASLCGVHCLNNLVQGAYFSEIDLMTIAQRLDQTEREMMAAQGVDSAAFLKYMAEESGNVSDSGDFSIQVMSEAMKNLGLSTELLSSERERANMNFDAETAFICNFRQHWFAIRKLATTWWNLDSLKDDPEYISPTYMAMLLAQLRAEGYSIFAVRGEFPRCTADDNPEIIQRLATQMAIQAPKASAGRKLVEEDELAAAIKMSLGGATGAIGAAEEDDPELAMALALSLQPNKEEAGPPPKGVNIMPEPPEGEEGAARVVMVLPGGDRIERRFRGSDRLEGILEFAAQAANMSQVQLATAYPSQVFSDGTVTVKDAGFVPSILVHIQPRRAAK